MTAPLDRLGPGLAAFLVTLSAAGASSAADDPPPTAEPAATAPNAPTAPTAGTVDTGTAPVAPEAAPDPTGGGYTSPTLLFIPAVAVPKWTVRVIASTELQSPSDIDAGFRPGLGAEVGLPAGFTLGAGTNWVGGDVNSDTNKTDFNLGLSPYFQARFHILGESSGQGFQLGVATTYKFVGFEGDPGEMEAALSAQYRRPRWEAGLQGVFGQDFGDLHNRDGEAHAYALYRVIPQLGVGAAGQVRVALSQAPDSTANHYDVVGGGIASLTIDRYQVGGLGGVSSIGLAQGQVGGLGQLFGSVRF
jgi:hypothetical protein